MLWEYLISSAERSPAASAVLTEEGRTDYDALLAGALQIASAARSAGLGRGDRVVLFVDNSIEYVLCYFGILLAGGVVVGQAAGNRERHLKTVLNHCRAVGVVAGGRNVRTVENVAPLCPSLGFVFLADTPEGAHNFDGVIVRSLAEIAATEEPCPLLPEGAPGDLAQIIYTSGTTGNPKGVMLTHGNLHANTESILSSLRLTSTDRVMAVLPFHYSYGNSLLLTHVACGGGVVIDNRFAYPQKIVERMAEEAVTGFAGVPSTFAILLDKTALTSTPLPALRMVTQAGGAMSPALGRRLCKALPGVKVFIMYGQTEASARLTCLDPDRLFEKPGSVGKAIPGVAIDVVGPEGGRVAPGETGEIVARGDNIMAGYWENPAETAKVLREDGLHTGDLARLDDEGYLFIVARKSDMIKSGAHRISPQEIEEVIMEDGRVHEVAVIGEPDPMMGENIVAVVVPKAGASITEREIGGFCRGQLPLYKIPKRIEFRASLPKTPSGKIKKELLRNGFRGL
jgi:long-chain acyl-CoA synthetase